MFCALLLLGTSLDGALASLARRAREASRRPRSAFAGATQYAAGFYDVDGVSFTLHSPLIGYVDASIHGHASTSSVLAVLSDPIARNSIFIDENERLLRVGKAFATDQEVTFYNVSLEDTLAVFGDLRINPSGMRRSPEAVKDRVDPALPVVSGGSHKFNWELEKASSKQCGLISGRFGVELTAYAWADWRFSSLANLRIEAGLDVDGQLGWGLTFPKGTVVPQNCPVVPDCREVAKAQASLVTLDFRGKLSICVALKMGQIQGSGPGPLEIYRQWHFKGSRNGVFKKTGALFTAPNLQLAVDGSNLLDVTKDLKMQNDSVLATSPEVAFYAEAEISIQSGPPSVLYVGFNLTLVYTFKGNQVGCLTPYVFGDTKFSAAAFYQSPAVTIRSHSLSKSGRNTVQLWNNESYSSGCWFTPGEAEDDYEGVQQPTVETGLLLSNAAVTWKKKKGVSILVAPKEGIAEVRTELELVYPAKDEAIESMLFRNFTVGPGVPGDIVITDRRFYFSRLWKKGEKPPRLRLKFMRGNKSFTGKIREVKDVPLGWVTSTKVQTVVSDELDCAVVTYQTRPLLRIQIYKMFKATAGTEGLLLSFVGSSLRTGDRIALIARTKNGRPYGVVTTAKIHDLWKDTTKEQAVGSYVVVRNFAVNVDFFRHDGRFSMVEILFTQGGKELGRYTASKAILSRSRLLFDIDFDRTPGKLVLGDLFVKDQLNVEVRATRIDGKPSVQITKWSKNVSVLVPKKEHIIKLKEGEDAQVELSIDSDPPPVLITSDAPWASEWTGVVCRAFELGTALKAAVKIDFLAHELYGVVYIDMPGYALPTKGVGLFVILELPGIVPLVAAREAEEDVWVIPLTEVTYDGKAVYVAFRRQVPKAEKGCQFRFIATFQGSTADYFCSITPRKIGVPAVIGPDTVNGPIVGCIYSTLVKGNIPTEWVAGFPDTPGRTPVPATGVASNGFQVLQFPLSGQLAPTVQFLPRKYVFSDNSSFLVLPRELADALSARQVKLQLEGDYVSGIKVVADDTVVLESKPPAATPARRTNKTIESVIAGKGTVVYVFAVWHGSPWEPVNRLVTLSIADSGPSVLNYGPAGATGLLPFSGKLNLRPGFSGQVVRGPATVVVYKTWAGKVEVTPLGTKGNITIRKEPAESQWKIWAEFTTAAGKAVRIPWNVVQYCKNRDWFFTALGVDKANLASVDLTPDGDILIGKQTDLSLSSAKKDVILSALDFTATEVVAVKVLERATKGGAWVTREDDDIDGGGVAAGLDGEVRVMVEVAVASFVGALLIGLLAVLVYRRRSKARKQSSSAVSGGSSSDDPRQENLVE